MAPALVMVLATIAQADLRTPMYVGNLAPVLDPLDRPMRGTHRPDGDPNQSLVELRVAPRSSPGAPGAVYPPDTNGLANPANPLLSVNGTVRMGLNAAGEDPGLFCVVFPERLPTDQPIFARVYNAPTIEEATFYADSDPIEDPGTSQNHLVLTFRATAPIDWRDDDGDGVVNSWEKFLDDEAAGAGDMDGDGVSDYHEWLAGTDPTDPESFLGISFIGRSGDGLVQPTGEGDEGLTSFRVVWRSVPGKTYQLEHAARLADHPSTGEASEFVPIGDAVAAGPEEHEMERLVDGSVDLVSGFFRIRVIAELR